LAAERAAAGDRVRPTYSRSGICGPTLHIPRLKSWASASARRSSSSRSSGVRAEIRASPSRSNTALIKVPSSVNTYASRRPYTSLRAPSNSSRTDRCRTRSASRCRASRANGAAVSNPCEISGASMPSSRTRPTVATSIVSPSNTTVTSTGPDRTDGGEI
jgi:hypothetical protein